MLLNFIKPTGNSTNKIYDLLGINLDCSLILAISQNTNLDIFADSLNLLCSCSLKTDTAPHFFLRCQNYTTLRRGLKTELKKY